MNYPDWRRAVKYGLPGLIVGLALAWVVGGRGLAAQQPARPPGAEASGTIAFTTTTGNSSQLLYLIDTRSQSFAIYRVEPQAARGAGSIKLESVRNYAYDLKLSEYNNLPPLPGAIEEQIRSNPSSKPH